MKWLNIHELFSFCIQESNVYLSCLALNSLSPILTLIDLYYQINFATCSRSNPTQFLLHQQQYHSNLSKICLRILNLLYYFPPIIIKIKHTIRILQSQCYATISLLNHRLHRTTYPLPPRYCTTRHHLHCSLHYYTSTSTTRPRLSHSSEKCTPLLDLEL